VIPAAAPIQARCRRCQGDFFLYEVVEDKTGECPRCQWPLSPDWTPLLLEEAKRADAAQRDLVTALRRLVGLPGNMEILPHSVLRNLFEDIGWERALASEPVLIREEIRRLRERVEAWELLAPDEGTSEERLSMVEALRRLGGRVRRLGRALDLSHDMEADKQGPQPAAGQAAREAAARLDGAADAAAAGEDSSEALRAGLDATEGVASVHGGSDDGLGRQTGGGPTVLVPLIPFCQEPLDSLGGVPTK